MKSKKSKNNIFKSVATHSLVAAIVVNPSVLYFVTVFFRTNEIVYDESLVRVMSVTSALAFVLSLTSFLIYKFKK